MNSFDVEILTPAGRVFAGAVESLVLPGSEGSFGVLAGHVPLLAQLSSGRIMVRQGDQEHYFNCGPGLANVATKHVTVLVDSAEEHT
ncbi:MAG: ATP synthase F1 subunit epsilon [Kiritimatiellae bacterium]|nr:ATP synthase F1 subunit epsilon [Kiritimatiellia bacterium]